MSRGRHRHSPPLHRLLPPSAVAGASVACATSALLLGDPVVLRVLVAAAAAAAVTGAVLMRSWDRAAGKRVAELTRARTSDEWRHEERVAELEADVEESRELRAALDTKLRRKRAELSRLRNEHAELLRRYATAETERASALEGRRLLELETVAPTKALPATPGDGLLGANGAPTPGAYAKADTALIELVRNSARQNAKRAAEAARRRELAEQERQQEAGAEREPQVNPATAEENPATAEENTATVAGDEAAFRTDAAADAAAGTATDEATGDASAADAADATAVLPGDDHRPVPAAVAVVPYQPLRRPTSRVEGGFDFFGAKAGARRREAIAASTQRLQLAPAIADPDEAVAPEEPVHGHGPAEEPVNGHASAGESPNGHGPAEESAHGHESSEAANGHGPAADAVADEPAADDTTEAVAEDLNGDAGTDGNEGAGTDGDGDLGTATGAGTPEGHVKEDLEGEDLADVVGAEVLAAAGQEDRGAGDVVDLTEHDETEQLDVRELRAHSS
ncbi:hypothetical protein [Streptomyces sp. NPDC048639]|uniref:hypothetical protein n=1 Tax=Streptomyces sp. NPDC048639 TaxID=3365581 RepID=UPI00371BD4D0